MPDLAYRMKLIPKKLNPKMKVMPAGGYYDLATPHFEGIYKMHHLPMPKSLQSNISYHYYEAGHTIYIRKDILKQFLSDVANFVKSTEAASKQPPTASTVRFTVNVVKGAAFRRQKFC